MTAMQPDLNPQLSTSDQATVRASARDIADALNVLAGCEPWIRAALARCGLPPYWRREPGFATLAQIILEQQVSLASAQAVFTRVQAAAGGISAVSLLAMGADGLGQAGVARPKQTALLALASACEAGTLKLCALDECDDDAVRNTLCALRGIGPWTVNVYLIIALGRADVWPANDVALLKSMQHLLALDVRPTPEQSAVIAARCAPHRSALARLLWHVRLHDTGREWLV
jgi:DNA-3-methyladenine glycosylase II